MGCVFGAKVVAERRAAFLAEPHNEVGRIGMEILVLTFSLSYFIAGLVAIPVALVLFARVERRPLLQWVLR